VANLESKESAMQAGDKFRQSFEVNRRIYDGFIDLFSDRNELHVSSDFARAKGFKSEVMHGNILCGFLSFFIGECLPQRNVIIHRLDISFSSPVYLGDKLVLLAEVLHFSESVGALELGFEFHNADPLRIAKGKIHIGLI
jgi:3-hydroxybutyryl-CoA dehydratase